MNNERVKEEIEEMKAEGMTDEQIKELHEMSKREKESKLTHIVGINALSIIGSEILPKSLNKESMQIDLRILNSFLHKLEKIDLSTQGEMKYLKGISGSKTLDKELLSLLDEK